MKSSCAKPRVLFVSLSVSLLVFCQLVTPSDALGGDGAYTGVDQLKIEAMTASPHPGADYDGYIVTLDEDAAGTVDREAEKEVARRIIDDETAVVSDPSDILEFAEPEAIDHVEPNYRVTSFDFPSEPPSDPLYRATQDYQWSLKKIDATSSWKRSLRGDGVTVAILDTGLNAGHEDINSDRILLGRNYSTDTKGPSWNDDNGHGSYVAGIMAARTNNKNKTNQGIGMAGITDQITLVICKVLDANGGGYLEDILEALNFLGSANPRVDVVNMSLGHPGASEAEEKAIQKLTDQGVIVVAAAGNDGNATGKRKNIMMYPAGYPEVIGVGSIGPKGSVSDFSTKNSSVDVSAPGENMVGLSNTTTNTYKIGGDGTSFASPVVAAAAAITKQKHPEANGAIFLDYLKQTVRDAGASGRDDSYGYGVLDLPRLITLIVGPEENNDIHQDEGTEILQIHFSANGGTRVTSVKNVFVGKQYGTLPTPRRNGWRFGGWFTSISNGVRITASTVARTKGTVTLYAQWIRLYTVSLNPNGGKVSKKSVTATAGKKYGALPKPTRAKYKFLGWYTKKSGGARVTGTTIFKLKKNQTLYAHWKRN